MSFYNFAKLVTIRQVFFEVKEFVTFLLQPYAKLNLFTSFAPFQLKELRIKVIENIFITPPSLLQTKQIKVLIQTCSFRQPVCKAKCINPKYFKYL